MLTGVEFIWEPPMILVLTGVEALEIEMSGCIRQFGLLLFVRL
jgi:hypothetical protein